MIAGTVWKNLVATLENNPDLSGYIKAVFQGFRTKGIGPETLPCIMLEPVSNNETQKEFNQTKDLYFNIDVYAFSDANYHDQKKLITGGKDYKGILDVEQDISACLQSSYSLGGTVIDIRFEPTRFDQLDFNRYPTRGMVMPIRILYRKTNNV